MNSPNEDIDRTLRTFFRREMPAQLPPAPGAETTIPVATADAAWTMTSGRVLAGLALAGILAIYLSVASFFPRTTSTGLGGQQIGSSKMIPKK